VNISTATAETFLVLDGSLRAKVFNKEIEFGKGECFFVVAETALEVKALSELNLFRVTVP
jgi:mannose-6-phosphate isomerase-like protein (cupin superfamily)